VQHIVALSRSAVTIRHWFEIDLDDASTEHVVATARQFGPERCRSAVQCLALTRDVQDAVRLMIATLCAPERLDRERVAPWLGG
jgi:hypothetical protein